MNSSINKKEILEENSIEYDKVTVKQIVSLPKKSKKQVIKDSSNNIFSGGDMINININAIQENLMNEENEKEESENLKPVKLISITKKKLDYDSFIPDCLKKLLSRINTDEVRKMVNQVKLKKIEAFKYTKLKVLEGKEEFYQSLEKQLIQISLVKDNKIANERIKELYKWYKFHLESNPLLQIGIMMKLPSEKLPSEKVVDLPKLKESSKNLKYGLRKFKVKKIKIDDSKKENVEENKLDSIKSNNIKNRFNNSKLAKSRSEKAFLKPIDINNIYSNEEGSRAFSKGTNQNKTFANKDEISLKKCEENNPSQEIKSSYSNYKQISPNDNDNKEYENEYKIIDQKCNSLSDKKFLEKVKEKLDDYGKQKANYNESMLNKYDMKNVIKYYKDNKVNEENNDQEDDQMTYTKLRPVRNNNFKSDSLGHYNTNDYNTTNSNNINKLNNNRFGLYENEEYGKINLFDTADKKIKNKPIKIGLSTDILSKNNNLIYSSKIYNTNSVSPSISRYDKFEYQTSIKNYKNINNTQHKDNNIKYINNEKKVFTNSIQNIDSNNKEIMPNTPKEKQFNVQFKLPTNKPKIIAIERYMKEKHFLPVDCASPTILQNTINQIRRENSELLNVKQVDNAKKSKNKKIFLTPLSSYDFNNPMFNKENDGIISVSSKQTFGEFNKYIKSNFNKLKPNYLNIRQSLNNVKCADADILKRSLEMSRSRRRYDDDSGEYSDNTFNKSIDYAFTNPQNNNYPCAYLPINGIGLLSLEEIERNMKCKSIPKDVSIMKKTVRKIKKKKKK